jgi:hypothetical protein
MKIKADRKLSINSYLLKPSKKCFKKYFWIPKKWMTIKTSVLISIKRLINYSWPTIISLIITLAYSITTINIPFVYGSPTKYLALISTLTYSTILKTKRRPKKQGEGSLKSV